MNKLNKIIKKLTKTYKNIIYAFYISGFSDPIFKFYYSIYNFFKKCKTIIEFLPIIWGHQDWDYSYIFKFNVYLHKRLYRGIYEDGHHIVKKSDKKALKAIIELYDRLSNDNNIQEDKRMRYFNQKWFKTDETELEFKEVVDKQTGRIYSTLYSAAFDSLSAEDKIKYNKERKEFYKIDEKLEKQNLELLYKLITKKHKVFWD